MFAWCSLESDFCNYMCFVTSFQEFSKVQVLTDLLISTSSLLLTKNSTTIAEGERKTTKIMATTNLVSV